MKYFEFDNASVGTMATGWNIGYQYSSDEKVVNYIPVVLSVEEIKERIESVWLHKEKFKKLINSFDKLVGEEKMELLVEFYTKNFAGLKNLLIEKYEKEYPIKKQIKSDLIFETIDGDCFKTELKVFTKNGVKLNGFKTYSKEDLDKLVKEGEIAIVGFVLGKQTRYMTGVVNRVGYVSKFLPEFDKMEVKELCEKYPSIVNEILADVTAEELKVDYEMLYLPAYKTSLKYLAGCAKASKESINQKKKNLTKQIATLDAENKKFTGIEKQILDTSKGR